MVEEEEELIGVRVGGTSKAMGRMVKYLFDGRKDGGWGIQQQ